MPVLGYGYIEVYDDIEYSFSIKDGEACLTRITLRIDREGAISVPARVSIERLNTVEYYPVRSVGDGYGSIWGNGIGVYNLIQGNMLIPEGVVEINANALRTPTSPRYWKIWSVKLPTTLKKVGNDAFSSISDSVKIDDLTAWYDIDFSNAGANPLASAHELALVDKSYFINNQYGYKPVTQLVVPEGLQRIKAYTFYNCWSLESVEFPISCSAIGDFAFHGCVNISELVLHDNITSVGTNAFQGCTKLQTASLGSRLTSVPSAMFKDCTSLSSVAIGENVTTIEANAFEGCSSLKEVTGAGKLTTIGDYAFSSTSLTNIPNGVTSIGAHAFEGCYASGLVLPNSVKTIGDSAFANASSLQYLVIPAGVENVGIGITMYCSRLLNIIGPRWLKPYFQICNPAAYYTYNDALISLNANGGGIDRESVSVDLYSAVGELPVPFRMNHYFLGWFTAAEGGDEVTPETVVTGDMTVYAHWEKISYEWRYSDNADGGITITGVSPALGDVIIPDEIDGKTVTMIGNGAFNDCSEITSVIISEGVVRISDGAFQYCTGLEVVELPHGLQEIGNSAFANCYELTGIVIPASVNKIERYAFWFCSSMDTVVFEGDKDAIDINIGAFSRSAYEDSLPYEWIIEDGVLKGIKGSCPLTLIIPEGVTEIGSQAFYAWVETGNPTACQNIHSIVFNDQLGAIGDESFYNCNGICDLYIPSNVKTIGEGSFASCYNLTNVVVAEGVESIGDYAFAYNNALTEVTLPATISQISDRAFGYSSQEVTLKVRVPWSLHGVLSNGQNGNTTIVVEYYGDAPDFYTITFDPCEGSVVGEALKSVPDGSPVRTLPTAMLGGYIFLGWYTAAEGGERVTSETTVTRDMTLYAHWEEIVYTYNYIDNGDGTVTLSRYDKNGNWVENPILPAPYGEFEVPSEIDGKTVTMIGDYAFDRCGGLTSVTIPDSVTSIGELAFFNCDGLTSVTIPDSVTSIGGYAFAWCGGLTSVTIPDSVTSIGYGAFEGCIGLREIVVAPDNPAYAAVSGLLLSKDRKTLIAVPSGLTSVAIPDCVTSIGELAFYGCYGLTSITIPDSVTSIGWMAFIECYGLSVVYLPNSLEGVIDEFNVFMNCSDDLELIYYNDYIVTYDVTFDANGGAIDGEATAGMVVREGSRIGSLPIPTKDGCAFLGWFTAAEGGERVTSETVVTGDMTLYAHWGKSNDDFADAREITGMAGTLTASNVGMTSEEGEGNYHSSTATLWFSWTAPANGNITIDTFGSNFDTMLGAYMGTGINNLTQIAFNDDSDGSVQSRVSFDVECGVTYFIMAGGYSSDTGDIILNWDLFTDTFEMNVVDGVVVGYRGTCPTTLTSEDWPDSVTSIGDYAFAWCSGLTSVTIPDSVTNIGDGAFYGCNGLSGITIPDSVTSIGVSAFLGCVGLQEFVVAPDNPAYTAVSGLLLSKDRETLIAVPGGLTSIAIPDCVTSIGEWAFYGCNDLTDVTIPDGVKSIGDYAFMGCDSLTSVSIPDSVTSIGLAAFNGCTVLADKDGFVIVRNVLYSYSGEDSEITIPDGVTSIGDYAFFGCSGLTSVTISDGVTGIGNYAFSNCSGLTGVTIPDGVTSIGEYAFSVCSELTDVTIPDSVTNIGERAFTGCALTDVCLPKSLEGHLDTSIVFDPGTSIHYRSNDNALPEMAKDAAPEVVTNAIAEAGFVDAAVKDVIGGSATEYIAFKEWARSVKVAGSGSMGTSSPTIAGEAAVVANAHAAAAYLLGAERLFENEPKVEITEVAVGEANDDGALGITRPTMTVAVTVKDGEETVMCAAEKVKAMFEATSDLGDWNGAAKLTPTVTTSGTDTSGKMIFEVTPGDGAANRAFLRIKR